MTDVAEPPVPKLPRGRGFRLSGPELFRIAITLAMLVAVVALTKPCSSAVSTFVMGFDGSAKGSAMAKSKVDLPKPSANPEDYERLDPNMSEDQVRAAVARSKAKLGSAATGSATPQPGSATPQLGSATPQLGSAAPVPRMPAPALTPGAVMTKQSGGSSAP